MKWTLPYNTTIFFPTLLFACFFDILKKETFRKRKIHLLEIFSTLQISIERF